MISKKNNKQEMQPTQSTMKEEGQIISSQSKGPEVYTTSTEGKVFHYGLVSKREYYRNEQKKQTSQRTKVISMDQGNKERYSSYERKTTTEDLRPSKVFVSGSPAVRSYNLNTENIFEYTTIRTRGGIVKFKRKGKFSSRTEIEKIIFIQQWWRNILQKLYQNKIAFSGKKSGNESEITSKSGYEYNDFDNSKFYSKEEYFKKRNESRTTKMLKREENEIREYNANINISHEQNYITNIKTIKIDKHILKGKMKEIWMNENEVSKVDYFNLVHSKENISDSNRKKNLKTIEYTRNKNILHTEKIIQNKELNQIEQVINFNLKRIYDASKYNMKLFEKRV